MKIVMRSLALVASTISVANAETIKILAKDLVFEPEAVNASTGDVLEFHFLPHNHSVVMGDYDKPCEPAGTGGFYSGFWPVMSGTGENETVFQVTINDTKPFVYYCSQGAAGYNHCKDGMAGTVNENDSSKLQDYKKTAAALDLNVSPASIFGGVLAPNSNATATSSPSTSSSAPSQTSSPDAALGGYTMAREAIGGGLVAVFMVLMMA